MAFLGKKKTKKLTRLFFATDIHGSERTYRKFINAGKVLRGEHHRDGRRHFRQADDPDHQEKATAITVPRCKAPSARSRPKRN